MVLLKAWLACLPAFVLIDFLWIGVVGKGFYVNNVGHLLRMEEGKLNAEVVPALLTWIALTGGVALFAVPRASAEHPALTGLLWGGLFGCLVYAVYDLTNRAVLDGWTWKVVAADIAWGTFICGVTGALCAYLVTVFEPSGK